MAATLTACGGDDKTAAKAKVENTVTQTRMDDIDSIEGTINDEMINVDETTEAAATASTDKETGGADKATSKAAAPKQGDSGEE